MSRVRIVCKCPEAPPPLGPGYPRINGIPPGLPDCEVTVIGDDGTEVQLNNVESIAWRCEANEIATATLTVHNIDLDIEATDPVLVEPRTHVHAVSRDPRYVALVRSFPVLGGRRDLGGAPGVSEHEIDLALLDSWASGENVYTSTRGPFPGTGAKQAAAFVLRLWNSTHRWRCEPFDLSRAFRAWDSDQIAAFRAYINDPFLP